MKTLFSIACGLWISFLPMAMAAGAADVNAHAASRLHYECNLTQWQLTPVRQLHQWKVVATETKALVATGALRTGSANPPPTTMAFEGDLYEGRVDLYDSPELPNNVINLTIIRRADAVSSQSVTALPSRYASVRLFAPDYKVELSCQLQ